MKLIPPVTSTHISKNKTIRLAAYRKLKTNIKYVPTTLPANKNSSYDVSTVDTNKKYLEEMLGEDISVVFVNVIHDLDHN